MEALSNPRRANGARFTESGQGSCESHMRGRRRGAPPNAHNGHVRPTACDARRRTRRGRCAQRSQRGKKLNACGLLACSLMASMLAHAVALMCLLGLTEPSHVAGCVRACWPTLTLNKLVSTPARLGGLGRAGRLKLRDHRAEARAGRPAIDVLNCWNGSPTWDSCSSEL